ncbi:glycosyltransferase [Rathayibacter tritici]|nr:glycosyltransferase [Rathayibacter tritici]PPF69424.1 glycosyltransferase [Rathayibacter tritici]PPG08205.1 glycosyltransferase [Rathayibacter tritici]PPI14176.1 glycosyltransferase [Rathayibacter tritici]PPI43574.1 glycosyltransferase [Rathayibacter tritici]
MRVRRRSIPRGSVRRATALWWPRRSPTWGAANSASHPAGSPGAARASRRGGRPPTSRYSSVPSWTPPSRFGRRSAVTWPASSPPSARTPRGDLPRPPPLPRSPGMTSYITGRIERMPASITTLDEAADAVLELSRSGRDELVVTPNTDHFVRWKHSGAFRRYYGRASLVVLDGTPLVWLARWYGHRSASRVTGIDLFTEVCRRAALEGAPVALIGGRPGVGDRAAAELQHRFPGLQLPVVVAPEPDELADDAYLARLSATLRAAEVRIVALCLGSPKQEEVRERLLEVGGTGAVCLGVGAAIDFLAGEIPRAPLLVQRLGLEWAHRLSREPGRLWRRYLGDALRVLPSVVAALRYRLRHASR